MIRFMLGLIITMGAVGGMEFPGSYSDLALQIMAAVIGLTLIAFGAEKLSRE